MSDPINPDHYRRFPVEVIEITACVHPKEKRFMRGWTEVCGDCGRGREIG